jgi:hypothetical protein
MKLERVHDFLSFYWQFKQQISDDVYDRLTDYFLFNIQNDNYRIPIVNYFRNWLEEVNNETRTIK